MHNKRIGRDDILKIEVSLLNSRVAPVLPSDANTFLSGLVLPRLRHGGLTAARGSALLAALPRVVVLQALAAALAIIPLVRMIAASATVIGITTATAATLATALAALLTGKDRRCMPL